eukprot:Hpha_TRINITY_DN33145_c0_g1::TRINITY_DN33145_c0_g1_i1::g.122381::m.122381
MDRERRRRSRAYAAVVIVMIAFLATQGVCEDQQLAAVEMYAAPEASSTCATCTCTDCPCSRLCGRCARGLLLARVAVEADGRCREAQRDSSRAGGVAAVGAVRYMAAVCGSGRWLAADGPTKEECEERARGLAEAHERGQYDGRTGNCLPASGGAWMRFVCGSDAPAPRGDTRQVVRLETDPKVAVRLGLLRAQAMLPDVAPFLVPLLLVIAMLRWRWCGLR